MERTKSNSEFVLERIVPLNNDTKCQVTSHWPLLQRVMTGVLGPLDDLDLLTLYHRFLSEDLLAFIVGEKWTEGDSPKRRPVGVIVCTVSKSIPTNALYVYAIHALDEIFIDQRAWAEILALLKKVARSLKCDRITSVTNNERSIRMQEALGADVSTRYIVHYLKESEDDS